MHAMKAIRWAFMILMTSIAFGTWAQDHSDDVHCKDLSEVVEVEQGHFSQHMLFRANPRTADYDVRYHRMEWSVDPAENYISGRVTTYFVPMLDGLDTINFDLEDNMHVNAVIYHGDSLNYSFTTTENLHVRLPEPLVAGDLDSLSIDYEGAPIATGLGSFRQGEHDGVPVIWTLSEPYGARSWWPCKQDLSDKIDSIDIIIRTPAEYRVASNGLLVRELQDGQDKIFYWNHRYPIPAYLVAIGVTNYGVFKDYVELGSGDSLEILNYIYPEDVAEAEVALESTIEIMILFDSLFGGYPFASEKYGHAQFGHSGGMEHQTMSFMGKFTYDLQAHELAHQWFGDKVTCGSWQDIWLNEGFATYLTGLTKEFLGTEEQFAQWKMDRVNHVTGNDAGSVWVDDTINVFRIFNGRLSYSKGAMLLHMLRWTMGDGDFFAGIKSYITAPELEFGYARTADLQFYLEQESGIDLSGFFDDWLYGEGWPSYHLTWTARDNLVSLILHQSTSHPSVDFYEMPVPIHLSGEGRDTMIRLEHTFDGQEFEVDVQFAVDSVAIDPDYWLISANNTVEFLPVGVIDFEVSQKQLKVTPNPFSDELVVDLKDPMVRVSQIDVIRSDGSLVKSLRIDDKPVRLNTSEWPCGMYFLQVLATHGVVYSRKVYKVD